MTIHNPIHNSSTPPTLHGELHRPDGAPMAGVTVRLFAKTWRGEELLGEVCTDEAGRYSYDLGGVPGISASLGRALFIA
jgi:5-hydroxyisourate hydrolase-like protein (transthyretin family)